MSKRLQLLILIFALVGTSAAPAFAQTPPQWVQVGTLSCKVDPNIGFIIVGYQPMEWVKPYDCDDKSAFAAPGRFNRQTEQCRVLIFSAFISTALLRA